MLNDLLRLLGDGGIHSTAELTRRLGINEALLATMTGDLTRRGIWPRSTSAVRRRATGAE